MESCPHNVLQDEVIVCKWWCRYISETRKSDETEYTPRGLQLLLEGLQRHLHKIHPDKDIRLFTDPLFKLLKNTCGAGFKQLHRKGVGDQSHPSFVNNKNEAGL